MNDAELKRRARALGTESVFHMINGAIQVQRDEVSRWLAGGVNARVRDAVAAAMAPPANAPDEPDTA